MMVIVFATILCKNQGRNNNSKQNIIHISFQKPKVTQLNEISYSSRLTSKRGQGGKMIDAAIADDKL